MRRSFGGVYALDHVRNRNPARAVSSRGKYRAGRGSTAERRGKANRQEHLGLYGGDKVRAKLESSNT